MARKEIVQCESEVLNVNACAWAGWGALRQHERISYACSSLLAASLEVHSVIKKYDNQMVRRDKSCNPLKIRRS